MPKNKPWVNLIMVSTLDKGRNKAQISREWGISVSGGPLYQKKPKNDIQEAVNNGLLDLDQESGTYKTNINSDYFKERLKDYIDNKINNEGVEYKTAQFFNIALNNMGEYIDFLSDPIIRENLFDIKVIKQYFVNKENAKEKAWMIFTAVVEVMSYPLTLKMLSNSNLVDKRVGSMLKPIVEKLLEREVSSNQKKIKERLIDLYDKYPDKFEDIESMYKSTVKNVILDLDL